LAYSYTADNINENNVYICLKKKSMLSFFKIQNYRPILDMKVGFLYAEGKSPNNYWKFSKIPFLEISLRE